MDSRTLQPTSESSPQAGYNGANRQRGSMVHIMLDTPDRLLVWHVTTATKRLGIRSIGTETSTISSRMPLYRAR
jgi:hypothetical protein